MQWCAGVCAALLLLVSCGKQEGEGDDGQSSEDSREIKIPSIGRKVKVGGAIQGWQPYTIRDWQIRMRDADFILHGIARKKFGNLDAFIKECDQSYPGGASYRSQFYDKFSSYDDYNNVNAGRYHEQYLTNLRKWAAENPEKGEPAVALAGFEIYLAWYARGAGYADTVTDEGWKKFAEHLERARDVLEDAPAAARKDPHYYSQWITIHLALQGGFAEVQKKFETGQNLDPNYIDLYLRVTNYLQPKWHGENVDDWHKWLLTVLDHPKLSEDDRLVLYGKVVRNNIKGTYRDLELASTTIYDVYGIDKEKFMRGLAANCKRYPKSSDWPSAYLYHAVKAKSEPAIKEALELMDKKFSAGVFGGEKEFFITLSLIEESYPRLVPLVK